MNKHDAILEKGSALLAIGGMVAAAEAHDLGYHTVALCAEELQDEGGVYFPPHIEVIRAPNDDRSGPMTERELEIACGAAERVTLAFLAGKRVLVTCAMGINRSAFVTGLALHQLTGMSGRDAIALIRKRRHPRCLSNETFQGVLLALPARRPR